MAFPKFNGSHYYLSVSREATTLELITNTPSFAFTCSIHVHFYLLEAHSFPCRIKVAFGFQKWLCKEENLHWRLLIPIFFFWIRKCIEQLETEVEWLCYLNSESISSSMYLHDLRLHWEAVADAKEPIFVLKQCFTLLKGDRKQYFWYCYEKFI